MIGTTVSHYRILEKLGEGGMGVVYKAEDSKLKRTVALKFLPRGLEAQEPERARFLQEAQAASALNHPNVCTIYDISEYQNQQYIVMEYVDGVTLRDKIAERSLQMADCIAYAIQIGEALKEAHSKGIVHRDIKAENIMVNTKKQVKVMDFGLAKLKGSSKLTKTSSTVGTLAYMAPEQIEGGEVDARSDIFSFGVVLYEMLTGHMPFRGEHEAAMVYSIVNEEPTPIHKYLPDASSELVHILDRALEKDPEDRYQTVHDMVIDIRRLKKQTSRVSLVVSASESSGRIFESIQESAESKPRRSKRTLAAVVVSAVVVVCAVIVFILLPRGPRINPDMTSRVVELPFRSVMYAGVSRDANWIVFPARDDRGKFDVYMMNLSGGEPRRVTNDSSSDMFGVSLSPDGSTILYGRRNEKQNNREIISASTQGGAGRVVIANALMADWMPHGQRIWFFAINLVRRDIVTHELWTSQPDGTDRQLAIVDTLVSRPNLRYSLSWSPDEKYFAWTRNFPDGHTEVIIRDRESGSERQLTSDGKRVDDVLWTPNNFIIYSSNKTGNFDLWIVSASGGDPVQLTRGIRFASPIGISDDSKRLVYAEQHDIGHIKIANLDDGLTRQLTVEDRGRGMPSISASGKYVAFAAREGDEASMTSNIYVIDREGKNTRQLTSGPEYKLNAAWSSDEKWITYSARATNEPLDSARVYLIQADNPGQPRSIGRGTSSYWIDEIQFVIWRSPNSYIGSLDRNANEKFFEDSARAYPILNGSHIAYWDYRKGYEGFWIVGTAQYQSSGIKGARMLHKGIQPTHRFVNDGKYMYYVEASTGTLHRISLPEGKDEPVWTKLPNMIYGWDVRKDGKEIVFSDAYRKRRFAVIDNLFK